MTALWGARNAAQLDQVEEAFGWKISADDYAAVEEILRKTIQDPVGPEFMAPPKISNKRNFKNPKKLERFLKSLAGG